MLKQMYRLTFLLIVSSYLLIIINCSSNPASVDNPPQTIIISSYSLPGGTNSWRYDYSDGSFSSSESYFDIGNGQMGMLIGTTGKDTMIIKGNSLVGYAYANGNRVIFGGGNGLLLEPSEIQDGKTYSASSTGYNQDYSISFKMDVSVKYVLSKNISVGTQNLSDCLYVESVLTIKDSNGNQLGSTTTCEFRAKGLGTVKLVDKAGTVLKRAIKITANGTVVFTS